MKLIKIFLLALIAIGYKANGESFGCKQDNLFMDKSIVIYSKKIPLTQGKKAIVGYWWFDWLMQWKWHAQKNGNTFYAYHDRYAKPKLIHFSMHRFMMRIFKGDTRIVDHADRNGLNNTPCNIRVATKSQNLANRISVGSSKYLGVSKHKSGKYTAQIANKNNKYYLGSFNTELEAAMAYDLKAKEVHGEFANLNFK